MVSKAERRRLHYDILGTFNHEMSKDDRFSNGITGVLFALANKAPAVIISGINPISSGHIYNDANLKRQHADTDADILQLLASRAAPIYTADVEVARKLSIPLWHDRRSRSDYADPTAQPAA